MIYIRYKTPAGMDLLVELHERQAPAGARVHHVQGETIIDAEVSLDDALSPVLEFGQTLLGRAGAAQLDGELTLGVGFTDRGHTFLTSDSTAAFFLRLKPVGSGSAATGSPLERLAIDYPWTKDQNRG